MIPANAVSSTIITVMPALSAVGRSLTRSILHEAYVVQRKTVPAIAAEHGTTSDVVRTAMVRARIPRRQGSAAHAPHYSGNPKRKWCPGCHSEHPLSHFHRQSRGPHGRVTYCRRCQATRSKRYFPRLTANRRLRKAQLVMEFGNQCAQCGLSNLPIDAYAFHHHTLSMGDPGYIQPGTVLTSPTAAILEREKVHWSMLCANCHTAHHGCNQTALEVLRTRNGRDQSVFDRQ